MEVLGCAFAAAVAEAPIALPAIPAPASFIKCRRAVFSADMLSFLSVLFAGRLCGSIDDDSLRIHKQPGYRSNKKHGCVVIKTNFPTGMAGRARQHCQPGNDRYANHLTQVADRVHEACNCS